MSAACDIIQVEVNLMPVLGEIKKGTEIGFKKRQVKYIWSACKGCDKERWVHLVKGEPVNQKCLKCMARRGKANHRWKGGKYIGSDGYIRIKLYPDDFFYPMAKNARGYVLEHRLVMAKFLNRCLLDWELIHHKNGVKVDNRIENLELLPHGRFHLVDLAVKSQIKRLERRIRYLERELAKK